MQPGGGREGRQRTVCRRCGANNFLGQAQCWQCRASLPPSEGPAAPLPVSRRVLLLCLTIGVLTFLIVLSVALRQRQPMSTAMPDTATPAPVRSPLPSDLSPPQASGPDPLTQQARRLIEQEGGRIGLTPTPGPDGRIPVQSGGSLTPEQWREANERLQSSPLLRRSPSPPVIGP